MQHQQQSDETTQLTSGSTLNSAIIALLFCAATFGYVGYTGLEFPNKNRSEVFVVFLVLSTVYFIVGSVFVWFKFNERSILNISEYQIRPMKMSQRVVYMTCLLGPLVIGSAVYFIGGFKGNFLIGIAATIVPFSCSMLVKRMKSHRNRM
jgi:hypothetical protein